VNAVKKAPKVHIILDYDVVVSRPETENGEGALHILYDKKDAPEAPEEAILRVAGGAISIELDGVALTRFDTVPASVVESVASFKHVILCRVNSGKVVDANRLLVINGV